MLKCSESQQKFLEMTATAGLKARLLAQEADKLGLKTLAREWDYFSNAFEAAIDRQLRVFDVKDVTEETFFFADRNGGLEGFLCVKQNEDWIRSAQTTRYRTVFDFMESFTQVGELRFNAKAGIWICARCGHGEHGPLCSAAPWCELCNGPYQGKQLHLG